jgi:hypothetical protein
MKLKSSNVTACNNLPFGLRNDGDLAPDVRQNDRFTRPSAYCQIA